MAWFKIYLTVWLSIFSRYGAVPSNGLKSLGCKGYETSIDDCTSSSATGCAGAALICEKWIPD